LGPDVRPNPKAKATGANANGHEPVVGAENPRIWVINNQTATTVRSRFYKSVLLGVSCAVQLLIAGEVLALFGPLTFVAFALGAVICASISAQEMGALLSAIDMRATRLKEALWGPVGEPQIGEPAESDSENKAPTRNSQGRKAPSLGPKS
jgi:hypothetical protein